MRIDIKIDVRKLLSQLSKIHKKAEKEQDSVAVVGYRESYAPWVHEATFERLRGLPRRSGRGRYWDAYGGARGGSKFLEGPSRRYKKEFEYIAFTTYQKKRSLRQALLGVAKFLRDMSKAEVPVEYGSLRKSARAYLLK